MATVSKNKSGQQNSEKSKSRRRKKKEKVEIVVTDNPPQYKLTQKGLTEAIESTVMNLIEPNGAALIPRPFRQPLSPAYYPDAIPISSEATDAVFSGVIAVYPSINRHVEITLNNNVPTTYSAGHFVPAIPHGSDSPFFNPPVGRYSIPFAVTDGADPPAQIAAASLIKLSGALADSFWALGLDGRWTKGYSWAVKGTWTSPSSNANFSNVILDRLNNGVTFAGQAVNVAKITENKTSLSTVASATTVDGTTAYALADFPGGQTAGYLTMFIQLFSPLPGDVYFNMTLKGVDFIINHPETIVLPIGPGNQAIYNAIIGQATQYSIPRYSARLEFTGSDAYGAGDIAAALVPNGFEYDRTDPAETLAKLSALPYHSYNGKARFGAHVCYFPARSQDLFLRDLEDVIEGNFILMSFVCPPTGDAGQTASFRLHIKPAPEWLADTSTLPQKIPPWDREMVDTIFSFLAEFNAASENPTHMKKLRDMANKIATNPIVREAASKVWTASKQAAVAAAPALLAMLV